MGSSAGPSSGKGSRVTLQRPFFIMTHGAKPEKSPLAENSSTRVPFL